MFKISLDIDTHQLEKIVGLLKTYSTNKVNFSKRIGGHQACVVIPAMLSELEEVLEGTKYLNQLTSRVNNTTRVSIQGCHTDLLVKALKVLESESI